MQYSGRILAALAAWIVLRCARSMLAADDAPEVWAYLSPPKGERIPVAHWECLVGRSGGADAVIDDPAAAGTHALLQRSSAGGWSVTDLSRGTGVLLNGRAVEGTAPIKSGDRLRIGKTTLRFTAQDVPRRDSPPRRRPASSATLLLLTLFELTLLLQHCFTAAAADRPGIILSFGILASLQWGGYFIERYAGARGFEPETLAFLLTAAAVFLAQMGLNVFGSMDLLPFTGVTFPFVSRGGSSLIACWGLLAFLKAADTRPGGSFALGRTVASKTPAGGGKPAAAKSAAAPDAKKDAKKPAAGKSGRSGQAGKRAARAETKKKGAGR